MSINSVNGIIFLLLLVVSRIIRSITTLVISLKPFLWVLVVGAQPFYPSRLEYLQVNNVGFYLRITRSQIIHWRYFRCHRQCKVLISVALNIQKNAHNELQKLHQLDQLDYEAYIGNNLRSSESETRNTDTNDIEGYEVLLDPEQYSETHYLHSKSWWAGILVMIIGELGNFIAYAFAPASVVAPLGTVALISNVILAPIMLKEKFRSQDLIGIIIAIIGAVFVVLTSKSEELKLSEEAMWNAIKKPQFIIYFTITCALAIFLIYLSGEIGHKLIIIDLSLVALFGGYTVLSTKAISSLLTTEFLMMFKHTLTYILLFVLISTAVLQVKFLNKALKQFDSTEVIPTQFVLFTMSAITGSAVLYNDFAEMDFWKCSSFLSGCFMTFLGVYFITSNRSKSQGYIPISHQEPNTMGRGSIIVDPLHPPLPDPTSLNTSERRFSQATSATTIPRRNTVLGLINSSNPTLYRAYGSMDNSSSRNDTFLQSIVNGVTTNSLTAGD
ncbi:18441_t:CDS:2 [Acaulospora morrowiae]|uniref:18441_t:CDS:1 n=1 Tax=Acaulospora morrowiae TaxID=94023 RepID=A0A9N9I0V7_9GLOM|nr:18441_t:CDS:2 [Acaulospora morrowiae]